MATDEEKIAALAPFLRWRPGLVTDPIGMELTLDRVDPAIRNQLIAARFEMVAAVHRTMAEGATKAAQIAGASVGNVSSPVQAASKSNG